MTEQTAAPTRRGFFRRNLSVLVTAAVLTVVATAAGVTWSSQHAALTEQEAEIDEVEEQVATIQKKNTERVNADVLAALGISQNRLSTDGERIKSLLSMAFTWNSARATKRHARA